MAAPSLANAQAGARAAIDTVGMPLGMTSGSVSSMITRALGVDMLSVEAVAAIGVDTSASVAVFGDATAPATTLVARVAHPEAFAAFMDRQRERGMKTTSVQIAGAEVFTAEIDRHLDVSWAIVDDWLWVHFAPAFTRKDGTGWFERSRAAVPGAWTKGYGWAEALAGEKAAFTGYLSPQKLVAHLTAFSPSLAACTNLLAPMQGVAFSVQIDGRTASAQLAFDLGGAANMVTAATLPVPEGFASFAQGAPMAAQWNLDVSAINAWLTPCPLTSDTGLAKILATGIRSGQVAVRDIDIDDKSGIGVASVTLTNKRYFANLLDDIPMRSRLESSRAFGGLRGYTLSIPFVTSVDYILDDTRGFVAMGDGVLARTVGSGKTVPGPLASIDVVPGALPIDKWTELFDAMDVHEPALIQVMQLFSDAHLTLTRQDTSLVITARATRAPR